MRPLEVRFWEKVAKTDTCWNWTGKRYRGWYGVFQIRKCRKESAHRASWIINRGIIPEGLCVLHTCDNPACVNPQHLFLGTHADNVHDCARKGRQRKGEAHPNSKLVTADILTIRRLRNEGMTVSMIAKQYNVAFNTIWQIDKGITWRQV